MSDSLFGMRARLIRYTRRFLFWLENRCLDCETVRHWCPSCKADVCCCVEDCKGRRK